MTAIALRLASTCLFSGALTFSPAIMAQTDASRVTPRDLRPETIGPGSSVEQDMVLESPVDDSAELALSEEAASLSIDLREIVISGGFPPMEEATARFIEPFRDRRTTVEELYALAGALEQLYNQEGYFLARVTIPPQEVRDGGAVQLLVVDGYLEALNLDAVPERQRAAIRKRLQHLLQRPRLHRDEIERALLLAGRTPGMPIRSTLVPGTAVGSAMLVLEGDYTPLAGSFSADNKLSDELGPWQSTLQLTANQLLGQGEQIYGYVSGDPNPVTLLRGDSTRNVMGGGINWPLGHDGKTMNLEFSTSDTRMAGTVWIPDTRSRFDRVTLRLGVPLRVRRDSEWTLNGSFEASRQVNDLPDFDFELYRDELRVLRLGLSARHSLSLRSQLSSSLQLSQGIKSGARTLKDVEATGIPFSRPGARPDFTKLDFNMGWSYLLPRGLLLNSTVRAQHAFTTPLPSAELFGLDGDDAVSAVESGRLAADGGITLRHELSRELSLWNSRLWMIPYGYVAGGKPNRISGHTTAAGLGLRAMSGPVQFFVEYGHSHSSPSQINGSELFARIQMVF